MRVDLKSLITIVLLVLTLYFTITAISEIEVSHYIWTPSLVEAVAVNFFLGLTTGVTCVTFCGMILVPHIAHSVGYIKQAVLSSILFSVSRLMLYILLAIAAFYLGNLILKSGIYITSLRIIMSSLLFLYGCWLRYGWPNLRISIRFKTTYAPTFLLGLIAGFTTICPTLWVAIIYSALMKTLLLSVTVIFSFWLGTTIWMVGLGAFSVKLRENVARTVEALEKFRRACGIFLISLGITFVILSVS
ncbi:hypothetical protein DRP04_01140 [Archaeoglobales archaeon]|nr:MAG: hypothetical protein DRP04_01140 [Archaeoglobales archaeon]